VHSKSYPVRLALWKSSKRLKGKRKASYPNMVLRFPKAMWPELKDLVGKPAQAHRQKGRIIIEFEV
jgi:hypothetical protein